MAKQVKKKYVVLVAGILVAILGYFDINSDESVLTSIGCQVFECVADE